VGRVGRGILTHGACPDRNPASAQRLGRGKGQQSLVISIKSSSAHGLMGKSTKLTDNPKRDGSRINGREQRWMTEGLYERKDCAVKECDKLPTTIRRMHRLILHGKIRAERTEGSQGQGAQAGRGEKGGCRTIRSFWKPISRRVSTRRFGKSPAATAFCRSAA
jgi:hypothetical protein